MIGRAQRDEDTIGQRSTGKMGCVCVCVGGGGVHIGLGGCVEGRGRPQGRGVGNGEGSKGVGRDSYLAHRAANVAHRCMWRSHRGGGGCCVCGKGGGFLFCECVAFKKAGLPAAKRGSVRRLLLKRGEGTTPAHTHTCNNTSYTTALHSGDRRGWGVQVLAFAVEMR